MITAFETGLQSILLLAIRLYWGVSFVFTGWNKLQNIATTADFFASLHVPFPTISAYFVGGIECIGGLCLILGLFSRMASIPLICVMIVALFTAHYEAQMHLWSTLNHYVAQPPFNFLLTALIVLAFGPGKISVDNFLHRNKK
jgi:putative oxidoreductase